MMRISSSCRGIAAVAALVAIVGCAHSRPKSVATDEHPLAQLDEGAPATIVEAPIAKPVTVADRHPLFRRPKAYYDSTGGSKITKTAAATVIGVPSGIGAEIRQIVSGQPSPP